MVEDLYTLDFSEISGYTEIGGWKVPLPKMPPLETMGNYGLPIEEQKFKRTPIPKELLKRKPTTEEEDEIIIREYHKFDNGVWVIIKGKPIYLWGDYYHFLNYWTVQSGSRPYFYLPQQKMYCFYNWIDMDDKCLGTNLIKGRRFRATEMVIHRGYFKIFRNRNMRFYMQSKNESTVTKNYNRVLNSHDKMFWFVKPINSGSTKNQAELSLTYPAKQVTSKSLREVAESVSDEEMYEHPEIGSKLQYGPCVASHFDGEKGEYVTVNEAGKLEGMSLLNVVGVLKHVVSLNNLETVIGKLHLESTVEEVNSSQLEEVITLYEQSDPENRNENGQTVSGLYRIFVSAAEGGKPDEWGFTDTEKEKEKINNTISALLKAGDTKGAANERRKTPLVIEDALTPSGDQCAFNKENLQEVLSILDFPAKGKEKPTITGNLMWEAGNMQGRVIFEPNPEGRWEFSMLAGPNTYPDNAIGWYGAERIPNNVNKIRIGIDPYDHKEVVDNRKSKGGAVGGIMYDDLKDGAKVGDDGKPYELAKDWETHQPIFTYYVRRDDPQDFFEDMLMSAVYCGAPVLFENNKQSIRNHFVNRGYSNFIMKRPEGTMSAAQRQGVLTDGIPASENTIQQYYDALDTFISRNANSIKHRNLIVDLLAMNRQNHGKHDLGVAFGWLLIAMTKKYAEVKAPEAEPEPWFEEHYV